MSTTGHPPYAWRCFACEAANKPGAGVCAACGFSACASGAEILAAGSGKSPDATARRSTVREESTVDALAEALAPLPLWRRAIAVCGGLALTVGALGLKVVASWSGIGWAVVGLVGGLVFLVLAFAGHGSSTSSGDSSRMR